MIKPINTYKRIKFSNYCIVKEKIVSQPARPTGVTHTHTLH